MKNNHKYEAWLDPLPHITIEVPINLPYTKVRPYITQEYIKAYPVLKTFQKGVVAANIHIKKQSLHRDITVLKSLIEEGG